MSPQCGFGGGGKGSSKTARSYTDALREPLREALDDVVLDAACRKSDRVGDSAPAAVSVGDHGESTQAEQVRAAVRVGVEPGAQPACGGSDQEAAELPSGRRHDLRAEGVEELDDGPLEQLQRDV